MSDCEKVIGKECLGVGLLLWGCYVGILVEAASGLYSRQQNHLDVWELWIVH